MNKTNVSSLKPPIDPFFFYGSIATSVLSSLGFISNSLSFIVFYKVGLNANIYKYIFSETLFYSLASLCKTVYPVDIPYLAINAKYLKPFNIQVYEMVVSDFLTNYFQMLAAYTGVAICLDRYMTVTNRVHMKFYSWKHSFPAFIIANICLCTGMMTPKICYISIYYYAETKMVNNILTNESISLIDYATSLQNNGNFSHIAIRDIVSYSMLIILNFLVIKHFKLIMKKKNK